MNSTNVEQVPAGERSPLSAAVLLPAPGTRHQAPAQHTVSQRRPTQPPVLQSPSSSTQPVLASFAMFKPKLGSSQIVLVKVRWTQCGATKAFRT